MSTLSDFQITSTDVNISKVDLDKLSQFKLRYPQETDTTLARYLIARKNNIDQASKLLENYYKFKQCRFFPILKINIMNEMSVGKIYVHVLVDRTDTKSENLDMEFSKHFAKYLQALYPERLARAIIHPTGLIFYGFWNIAKWFLDPVTRGKFNPMLYQYGVKEFIDDEYIPIEMGGKCTYVYSPDDFQEPYSPELIEQGMDEVHQLAHNEKGSFISFFDNDMIIDDTTGGEIDGGDRDDSIPVNDSEGTDGHNNTSYLKEECG
eukprot:gene12524-16798_t